MPDTDARVREYWSWIIAENPTPEAEQVIHSTEAPSVTIGDGRVRPLKPASAGHSERRRWVVAPVAAVVALAVMAPMLLFVGDDEPDAGSTELDVITTVSATIGEDAPAGLTGLPPVDATPSGPETGELVASMYQHIRAGGSFGDSVLFLFADGRLIWTRGDQARWHCSPVCSGQAADLTGWYEQRLTPEGVELIRSVAIATGLFDPDQQRSRPATEDGYVQVRNGGQLVFRGVVPELIEQLAQLWTWLPTSAWEESEPKAFVPSRYAVCVHVGGFVEPVAPAEHIHQLPSAAQDLLAGFRQLYIADLAGNDPAGFSGAPLLSDRSVADGSPGYCFDISTQEARTFVATLRNAEAEALDASGVAFLISGTRLGDSGAVGPDAVTLSIWPILPHGVPAFTGG